VVTVDGKPFALDGREALAGALHEGAHLEVPADATLEIVASNTIAFRLAPGSDLRLPAGRRGVWQRILDARITRGIVLVATGPSFRGERMEIAAPEGRIAVSGTTFSIICNDQGTCVCVLDGRVGVAPSTGSKWQGVNPGWRRLFPRAPAKAMVDRLRPEERAALTEFRTRQGFHSAS
jgi:ferric-dicitrate binding protein FerR (iron transport regulator)